MLVFPQHLFAAGGQSGQQRKIDSALGLFTDFGRWTESVNLVYDPDDAPEVYADSSSLLDVLTQAAAEWEKVSGIRFRILDPDPLIADDSNSPSSLQDGLVRVSWIDTDNFAGRASPEYGLFDQALGYQPFVDGRLELSNVAGTFPDDETLKRILVHELGHLIGLGHAINPHSVMFANPYNRLRHPREDDIRAVQALYGSPSVTLAPSQPVDAWLFPVPGPAADNIVEKLFQPTAQLDKGAAFSLRNGGISASEVGEVIQAISDSTPNGKLLRFNMGGIDNRDSSEALYLETQWILTDPSGYEFKRKTESLRCDAGEFCRSPYWNFLNTNIVKSVPGTWHIHILDSTDGLDKATTLLSMPLVVDTDPGENRAPVTTLAVAAGSQPGHVHFQLQIDDFEGDRIQVKWHAPYTDEVRDELVAGATLDRELVFSGRGPYTVFVELSDDGVGYEDTQGRQNFGNAGKGFQNLLRIDFSLPLEAEAVNILSSQGAVLPGNTAMYQWMADSGEQASVIAIGGAATQAQMFVSATGNGGVTYDTSFDASEDVIVAGNIVPEGDQLGAAAEIFVVLQDADGDLYVRNMDGFFVAWNSRLRDLEAAYELDSLQANNGFEIARDLSGKGRSRIYVGYRLLSGSTLWVSAQPWDLESR